MPDVIEEIAGERRRQVVVEGFSHDLDDTYTSGELWRGAICYAEYPPTTPPARWPWSNRWWKPTTRRRDLIKAAALLVAEIERLDRAAKRSRQVAAADYPRFDVSVALVRGLYHACVELSPDHGTCGVGATPEQALRHLAGSLEKERS